MIKVGLLAAIVFSLTACGGQPAKPVAVSRDVDSALSCAHLLAELENNQKRIKELAGERSESARDNVGLAIMSPLFLDLGNTEKVEATALGERNIHVIGLLRERACSGAPISAASVEDNKKAE